MHKSKTDKKCSLWSSSETKTSSHFGLSTKHRSQLWKTHLNPFVNFKYHKMMLQRDRQINRKLFSSVIRSHTYRRKAKSFSEDLKTTKVRVNTLKIHKQSTDIESEYMLTKPKRKTETIGTQTNEAVTMSREEYEMKEEERKYLRQKLIDHYGILHGKKF